MDHAIVFVGMGLFFIAGLANVRFWLSPTDCNFATAIFTTVVILSFTIFLALRAAP